MTIIPPAPRRVMVSSLLTIIAHATASYDEVTRRKPRRAGPRGYMERSGSRVVVGSGIASRVVGATTVERMVEGRYEWRDGGLRPMRGARKRHWEQEHARGDG
ncbi:hypothetical protein OAO87_03915 [bacterium]|nr:hypothetical protein [bacterium]